MFIKSDSAHIPLVIKMEKYVALVLSEDFFIVVNTSTAK